MSRLEFLTRRGCPLCEETLTRLERGAPPRIEITVIDIDLDPGLLARFDHRVPVVRDPDSGRILAEGVVSDAEIADALATVR